MDVMDEPFFSWNRRRMILHTNRCPVPESSGSPAGAGLVSDVPLTVGTRRGRLITVVVDDDEYVALVVGDVRGRHDVPVRRVVTEGLLIEGSRSGSTRRSCCPFRRHPSFPYRMSGGSRTLGARTPRRCRHSSRTPEPGPSPSNSPRRRVRPLGS